MLTRRTCRRERDARAVRWRSVLARLVVMAVFGVAVAPAPAASADSGDRSLVEALESLADAGLPIVFSSRFVKPEMRVERPVGAESLQDRLHALLSQHGLTVEEGPNGVLMVVPSREPEPVRAHAASRQSFAEASGSPSSEPQAIPAWTLRETIDVVQGNDLPAASKPGASFDRDQIESLPDQRDPWALFSRVAGVTTDRIDVGGSESGQQTALSAPAASVTANTYFVDGIEATDLAAAGSSTLFYDLDHFATVELGTGGVDVTTPTAGVAVRLTTKRGGHDLRGGLSTSLTGASGSANEVGLFGNSSLGSSGLFGSRIEQIGRFGFDIGGPLLADRVWAWGGLSATDVDTTATGGERDDTDLFHGAIKVNAQPHPSASLVAAVISSDKRKSARGVSATRSLASAWRQQTPSTGLKAEHAQVLNPKSVLNARASLVDGEFSLRSRGRGEAFMDPDGVWQDGFSSGDSDRDIRRYEISADFFKASGRVDHELRFGASYRRFDNASSFSWPGGRQASRVACEIVGSCPRPDVPPEATGELIVFYRDGTAVSEVDSEALWAQDTLSMRRMTLDLGLRLDRQRGSVTPGTVAANEIVPEVLPEVTSAGVDGGFDWSTLSPRIGITWAFGAERRTVARLGFSRFSSQLAGGFVSRLDPVQTASASYLYQDLNGDRDWQSDEPLRLLGVFGTNTAASSAGASPNRNDPDLEPELTDEMIASLDHDLSSQMSLGARLTWRRVHDIHDSRLLILDAEDTVRLARPDDYRLDRTLATTRPDGTAREREVFVLRPGRNLSGGTWLTNGDREREYLGIGLSMIRRQGRRYMLRANVDWGNTEWRVPDAFGVFGDPNDRVGSDANDGDLFAERPSNSDAFLNSGWSANVSGNVRFAPDRRWGFLLAGNVFARQGHPLPFFAISLAGDGLRRELQVTDRIDEFRNPDLVVVDLRLSKDFRLRGALDATVSLEVFNALDRRTALERELNVESFFAGTPSRTVSPRVFRLGFRLAWK